MANNEGTPLHGDRSAWNTVDHADEHARDINDSALLRHLPAPASAGNYARDDGSNWQAQSGIPLADLIGYVQGYIIRGGAADWEAYDASGSRQVLIGDGTDVESRALINADLPDPYAFKTAPSTLTLSGDAVTATQNLHTIAAESGTEDDLDTINGLTARQLLLIQADTGDTITVKHGTGNIHFDSGLDFELSGDSWILFFYDGTNAVALGAGGGGDASVVTYTPGTLTDWDSDADPGDVDDALDQLADRTTDLEASGVGLLFAQVVDVTLVNDTSETTLLGAGRGAKIVTADTLDVGSAIRIIASGYLSTTGTPTLDVDVDLGGTEVATMGAITTATVSSVGWRLEIEITCRVTGASGEVVASGMFEYGDGNQHDLLKTSATTVDTTGDLSIDITGQWGTADASNTITCQEATIELLKADRLAVAAPSSLTATEA